MKSSTFHQNSWFLNTLQINILVDLKFIYGIFICFFCILGQLLSFSEDPYELFDFIKIVLNLFFLYHHY